VELYLYSPHRSSWRNKEQLYVYYYDGRSSVTAVGNTLITQACDQKTFLTRVAVSYAFFHADNGKSSEKAPSRTIFAQISIFDFGTQWITTGC